MLFDKDGRPIITGTPSEIAALQIVCGFNAAVVSNGGQPIPIDSAQQAANFIVKLAREIQHERKVAALSVAKKSASDPDFESRLTEARALFGGNNKGGNNGPEGRETVSDCSNGDSNRGDTNVVPLRNRVCSESEDSTEPSNRGLQRELGNTAG